MNIRITEALYAQARKCTAVSFAEGLERPPESGCLLLLGHSEHPTSPSLLVAEVLPSGEGDLDERGPDGLVFSSAYLRRALLRVRETGLAGFLTVHTHPLSDRRVCFSHYDDRNDPSLMSNLNELQPGGLFGSVVLGKNSAAARLWDAGGGFSRIDQLIIVGEAIKSVPLSGGPTPDQAAPSEAFDRGRALTGEGALARLSKMRVGVVGASGTGSLVIELLVRAGAGEVLVFDFDGIEGANLNRILHSRRRDADARAPKAERLAQALAEAGMPTKVTVARCGDVTYSAAAAELRGCDLIFGCVDRDWPRLVLCELAYQYLIPYIDLGTEIGVGEDAVQSLDSRVSYVAPGRPCLVCSGIVSPERVRLEGLGEAELKRVLAMGYSSDVTMVAPAVMELNMRAASYGVLLLRHLLQEFLDTPPPTHIKESLTNYSIRAVRREARPGCDLCGAGGRTGRGDSLRLTVRPSTATSGGASSATVRATSRARATLVPHSVNEERR